MATTALSSAPVRWHFQPPPIVFAALLILAASYNGILAAINANIFGISYGMVALTETGLLGFCLALALAMGVVPRDVPPLLMLIAFMVIGLLMSIGNDRPFVDMVRNIAIVVTFTILGLRIERRALILGALVLSAVVLFFLVIEIADQSLYVEIFQPAKYLESSRGIKPFKYNDTGLFANALGFQGRFSFGLFNVPRTSSIFIEQVSLASFAAVITIFLLAFWSRLPRWHRILHVAVVLLILTSNNSRTSSLLFLSALAGYFIYPRLPRGLNLALAPGLLVFAALFVVATGAQALASDDLGGRFALTIAGLHKMDVGTLLLGSPGLAAASLDSGYVYLIAASTLIGLVIYWLYVCLILPPRTIDQQRGLWGLNVYIFTWLMIGGTATFTIKTASLLWLLIGHLRAGENDPAPACDAALPYVGAELARS